MPTTPPAKHEQVRRAFALYTPHGDQAGKMQAVRKMGLDVGLYLLEHTPESREQSLALTALEEVVFWANAAIVREAKANEST